MARRSWARSRRCTLRNSFAVCNSSEDSLYRVSAIPSNHATNHAQVRPAEQALGAAQRVARPLLARLQVEHAAAVGRARVGAPRRNSGAGLLRRARRRAQPLVVEHDVERARPQRRRRHALRARPPLRLLPLGDAAQRPALFHEAPEQGRRPRPLRPPLRRVALRRRPPRLGACPAVRPPPTARAYFCPLRPHSRTRCGRARRCTSRARRPPCPASASAATSSETHVARVLTITHGITGQTPA